MAGENSMSVSNRLSTIFCGCTARASLLVAAAEVLLKQQLVNVHRHAQNMVQRASNCAEVVSTAAWLHALPTFCCLNPFCTEPQHALANDQHTV
jgi:hypothetical protein